MLKEMLQEAKTQELHEYLNSAHAYDLAIEFIDLNEHERNQIYGFLSEEKLADLVSYLESEDAATILSEFDIEKQKLLLQTMEPDDAADIIKAFDEDDQQEIVEVLGEDDQAVQLIQYDDNETGSIMNNSIIVIYPQMDVKEATKKMIEKAPDVETINTLFVVNQYNQYLGTISLRELIKAKSPCIVETFMKESPFVYDKDSIEKSVKSIRDYGITEIPVCNDTKTLLGMITIDDALDSYHEEAKEDFEKLSALPEIVSEKTFKSAIHRLPWLFILLALSLPIAIVTSMYEEILAAVVILIVFQPMILDSAGNIATQTLAVTLKVFSSGESKKGILKNSLNEILTGIMNGLVIGLAAFLMTYTFAKINPSLTTSPVLVAFVVGLSLWTTVIFAPIVAILVPLFLRLIKIDPAVASGPFITTIIDVIALVIYLGLATLMLGGL